MSQITLTLKLSHHHAGGYQLNARATYGPDDEVDFTEPLPIVIDQSLLLENNLSPHVVGEHLTQCVFGGTLLRQLLCNAQAACTSQPLGLRLVISDDCPELHGYPWEQMVDPAQLFGPNHVPGQSGFWFRSQTVTFARRRPQHDRRRPLAAARQALRALVIIANPIDISNYGLSAIDVNAQTAALDKVLEPFAQITMLAQGVSSAAGLPTLADLRDRLHQQPHLVYLICHGTNRESKETLQQFLWLEGPDGRPHPVPVDEIVDAFRSLSSPPPLVVIAACHSAGDEHRALSPAQIGPALVDAGVGAVVAMRGSVAIADVEALMPKLIDRLAKHGRIDLALAEARAAMPAQAQWWRTILFTRADSGQIWHEVEGYERLLKGLKTWQALHRTRFGINEAEVHHLADLIATCGAFQLNLEALLETVEHQNDPQAVMRLLDQLWLYEGTSDERSKVEQWLDAYPLDLPFTPARLAELRAIFSQVAHAIASTSGLEHCLMLAFDHWGAPPPITSADVAEWLNTARLKLGSLELRHRRYQPLQAFCQHLAQLPGLPTELQAELRSWAAAAAADLGIVHTQPGEAAPEGIFDSYLCVVAKPDDPCEPYKIELSAFFFYGGLNTNQSNLKDWGQVRPDPPEALPDGLKDDLEGAKTRIIAYLRAVVKQVQRRLMQRSLMVEIFLPDNLWEISQSLLDVRLSNDRFAKVLAPTYPLAVRLVERSTLVGNVELHIDHFNRWQRWKNHPILDTDTYHKVCQASQCDPEVLCNMLRHGAYVCVIGQITPGDPAGVAAAIREAGTPIAIWVDGAGVADPDLDVVLNKLLANGRDLPKEVLQLRKQAWLPGAASQLGRHLTLLWDNPNRSPPSALPLQPLQ